MILLLGSIDLSGFKFWFFMGGCVNLREVGINFDIRISKNIVKNFLNNYLGKRVIICWSIVRNCKFKFI